MRNLLFPFFKNFKSDVDEQGHHLRFFHAHCRGIMESFSIHMHEVSGSTLVVEVTVYLSGRIIPVCFFFGKLLVLVLPYFSGKWLLQPKKIMPLEKFSLSCPQIQFPSYGSSRNSTERHVKPQNFLSVVSWLQELFSKIPAFTLDMRHVYIQYFWLPRLLLLWCSGTLFASHVRGLGFEPDQVRSCILRFFHVVQIVG